MSGRADTFVNPPGGAHADAPARTAATPHRRRGRQARLEAQLAGVLTTDAHEVLDYLMVPIRGTQLASELSIDAADGSNVRLPRAAIRIARLEAPAVAEGLRVMRALSRTVDVVIEPPIAPTVWSAWRLRGLAAVGGTRSSSPGPGIQGRGPWRYRASTGGARR